jgi:hypothetical protein
MKIKLLYISPLILTFSPLGEKNSILLPYLFKILQHDHKIIERCCKGKLIYGTLQCSVPCSVADGEYQLNPKARSSCNSLMFLISFSKK